MDKNLFDRYFNEVTIGKKEEKKEIEISTEPFGLKEDLPFLKYNREKEMGEE